MFRYLAPAGNKLPINIIYKALIMMRRADPQGHQLYTWPYVV